ncbi:hypothetical protein QQS21_000518 [Conoideocrella luteorostrata]|uniref:Uncharacterized protein n=1 Tax=Conoideocrella luteorostrata TaxID=1105319 RepID=A0AAJ0G2M8_9HYPO|nr:hypothetical protein QQS21_000518 [Conoideocrella luteorostrata]
MQASAPLLSPSSSSSTSTPPPRIRVDGKEQWAGLIRSVLRPILVHLNEDTTWLLQLPRHNKWFNILIDPWLQHSQSDVHPLFSTQSHVSLPSVATIEDLNKILQDIEGARPQTGAEGRGPGPNASMIDAVVISHEFTDHCHQKTLLELPRSTPVYAADVAADLIRSWGYFTQVITAPALGAGVKWSQLTVGPLPDWLAIGRVITPGNALYYHSAIIFAFDIGAGDGGEAILYSPHGIDSKDLAGLEASGLKILALLHGLDDVRIWLTKQLNLGALNGIRAASKAKYWFPTHDEKKKGTGLIGYLLQRTSYSFEEAVCHEEQRLKQIDGGEYLPSYQFMKLGSGDGLVLLA